MGNMCCAIGRIKQARIKQSKSHMRVKSQNTVQKRVPSHKKGKSTSDVLQAIDRYVNQMQETGQSEHNIYDTLSSQSFDSQQIQDAEEQVYIVSLKTITEETGDYPIYCLKQISSLNQDQKDSILQQIACFQLYNTKEILDSFIEIEVYYSRVRQDQKMLVLTNYSIYIFSADFRNLDRRLMFQNLRMLGCTYDRQCIILHVTQKILEGDLWFYCYIGEDIIKAITIHYKELQSQYLPAYSVQSVSELGNKFNMMGQGGSAIQQTEQGQKLNEILFRYGQIAENIQFVLQSSWQERPQVQTPCLIMLTDQNLYALTQDYSFLYKVSLKTIIDINQITEHPMVLIGTEFAQYFIVNIEQKPAQSLLKVVNNQKRKPVNTKPMSLLMAEAYLQTQQIEHLEEMKQQRQLLRRVGNQQQMIEFTVLKNTPQRRRSLLI